jgi:hypothetical protein
METEATADKTYVPSPFPGLRDVYVLAAGLLIGVLLGPAGLGRVSPGAYAELFAAGAVREAVVTQANDTALHLAAMRSTGVSGDAVDEHAAQREAEAVVLRGALASAMDRRALGLILGVGGALFAVMLVEALVGPVGRGGSERVRVPGVLARLVTLRYALLAVGLAVLVARPTLVLGLPWGFGLMLLVVGAAVAWVPLGRRAKAEAPGH